MSYKISFILSLFFVIQLLILGGDLLSLQMYHAQLDALAQTSGFRIAQAGRLDAATESWLEEKNVTITCLSSCTPRFGDTLEFRLETTYDPLIISPEPMTIAISRSTVIGYYH